MFIPFPSVIRKSFRINSYVRILATKGRVVNLNNSKDALLRVARLRNNFHHQLTRELVNKYQYISVEDLCVKGLARTRMAKSVYDVGWGEFLRQLEYKAEWAGRTFTKYPRFQRSTSVCPDCGHVGDKLPLSVREWTCGECGVVHDRDVAAAKIIEVGAVCPEPKEKSPSKCSHISDMELSVVGRDDFNQSRPPEPEQIELPRLRVERDKHPCYKVP